MAKERTGGLAPPHGVRAMVPVLAASGGAGRSTVAGLLAQVYAPTARTALIDPSPRAVSPWADWLGVGIARPEAAGITALAGAPGAGRGDGRWAGLSTASVREAVTRRPVPSGRRGDAGGDVGYDVLADTRPWTRPPVGLPADPRWYARVLELGDWSAGVIDVGVPIVAAHLAARQAVRASLLDVWLRRADAVPVLVTSAHGFGAAVLVRLITALEQDGISAERMVVAVVHTAGTDPPRWMHTELAQVSGRLAALVEIPYDKTIRADGLARLDGLGGATLKAAQEIARTVSGLVRHHPDDPEAEEPYAVGSADPLAVPTASPVRADPGAATGERYQGRSVDQYQVRPAERTRPAAPAEPHPATDPGTSPSPAPDPATPGPAAPDPASPGPASPNQETSNPPGRTGWVPTRR